MVDPDFRSATASSASRKTLDLVRSMIGCCCSSATCRHLECVLAKHRTSRRLEIQGLAFDWRAFDCRGRKVLTLEHELALMSLTHSNNVRLAAMTVILRLLLLGCLKEDSTIWKTLCFSAGSHEKIYFGKQTMQIVYPHEATDQQYARGSLAGPDLVDLKSACPTDNHVIGHCPLSFFPRRYFRGRNVHEIEAEAEAVRKTAGNQD